MNRGFFINHLINEECYPDEEYNSTVSQLWRNAINGEVCYVPYEDELALRVWCNIVYELRISPPLQYDADYHVYHGWRMFQNKGEINNMNGKTGESDYI